MGFLTHIVASQHSGNLADPVLTRDFSDCGGGRATCNDLFYDVVMGRLGRDRR